jgi:imidazolonepropionase-like amidohydrolase
VAREFKLRPVIAGGAEAWKVARELAAAKVPVLVFPLAQVSSFDALGAREDNAAKLFAAGVPVGISTGETHHARKLRQVAGNAVRSGLPHDAAIAAITRVPAEALGLGARYGTLAPGKTANLVVWSGDPLELSTHVVDVVIHGRRVPLRNRQTALFEKYRTLSR